MSTLDMTFKDAAEELTGEEMNVVERQHGKAFETLSATDAMFSVVWMYERRSDPKLTLAGIRKAWTLRKVHEYFADEEMQALTGEADFPSEAG
jgi:hypothetical protein